MKKFAILTVLFVTLACFVQVGEAQVTRFPNGLNNAVKTGPARNLPTVDPSRCFVFFDDLISDGSSATNGSWHNVKFGAQNAGTFLMSDANYGITALTANATAAYYNYAEWGPSPASDAVEFITLESGKELWFRSRISGASITNGTMVAGLRDKSSIPLTSSNEAGFRVYNGDLRFYLTKGASNINLQGLATLSQDTYYDLAFHYNGVDSIGLYVNNALIGSVTQTYVDANMPIVELSTGFGVSVGNTINAGADTVDMNVDYIMVAKER